MLKKISKIFLIIAMLGNLAKIDISTHAKEQIKSSKDKINKVISVDDEKQNILTLEEGGAAPDFELLNKNEKKLTLQDLKGKYIYINFWSSWCEPCLEEIPKLNDLYQKFKDNENFIFLSVASAKDKIFKNLMAVDDTAENIMKIASEHNVAYPIWFDYQGKTFNNYMIQAFPTHIIIDKNSQIKKVIVGEIPIQILENEIEKLIED